jgi:hypothetical protein
MRYILKSLLPCLTALLMMTAMNAWSQSTTVKPDARLKQIMDASTLEQISLQKPELILYYNYYLDNAFYVAKLNNEKPVTGTDIHTVGIKGKSGKFAETTFDQQRFNVLKYDFNRELDRFVTYVWKEAGVALVFYPQRHFQAAFQQHLKEVSR